MRRTLHFGKDFTLSTRNPHNCTTRSSSRMNGPRCSRWGSTINRANCIIYFVCFCLSSTTPRVRMANTPKTDESVINSLKTMPDVRPPARMSVRSDNLRCMSCNSQNSDTIMSPCRCTGMYKTYFLYTTHKQFSANGARLTVISTQSYPGMVPRSVSAPGVEWKFFRGGV